MNEYTPTTGQIENAWCSRYDGEHSWARGEELRGYEAEFDRWLEQIKNEARAEGWSQAAVLAEQTAATTLDLDATLAALRTGKKEQDA